MCRICAAIGAMVSFVCRRGFKSHSAAIDVAEEGTSDKPWTSTRIPAMVKVWREMGGGGEAWELSRGLFVAAMVCCVLRACDCEKSVCQ